MKLQFTALSFTSATLSWMPPNDSPNCVHSYTILVNESSLQATFNSSVYNTSSTSLNVTGLSRGVEYIFTVTGRDRAGREGESEKMLLSLEGMILFIYYCKLIILTKVLIFYTFKVPLMIVDLEVYPALSSDNVTVLALWKVGCG